MRNRLRAALGVGIVAVCLLAGRQAFAQLITADIVGTVTDAAMAVVPGAKVTVTNTATGAVRTAQSGATGDYVFNLLPPGPYSVAVEASSFRRFLATITLVAGDRARVDAELQIGSTTQTVEVTAITPALQTDSATIRDTVTGQAVQDLPLNGRNYVTLLSNTVGAMPMPGSNITGGTRPDERRQTNQFVANGQNEIFNNQMVDGMDNNEREQGGILWRPSIDSIAELKVDINNYTAEVARAGGAVVNIITKSGTNTFHGGLYEFLRNDKLNANDYFSNSAGTPRPAYRQNQFGGSIGGPIRKDKTFFFGDVEALRIINGTGTGLMSTVTAYELAHPGDFSDVGGPVVPPSQIDPIALKYFALLPPANVPCRTPGTTACSTNNYSGNIAKVYNGTTVDTRVDQRFGDKDSMFARFSYTPIHVVAPSLFPPVNGVGVGNGTYPGTSDEDSQAYMLDYVHVFSPSLVTEAKGGFTRLNIVTVPPNYGTNISTKWGIPNVDINPYISGLMTVSVNGYVGSNTCVGCGNTFGDPTSVPILDVNNVFQYDQSLIWNKGRHNVKFGGGVIRRQMNYFQNTSGYGVYNFSSSTAGAPPNSMANFLLGVPTTIARQVAFEYQYFRIWEPHGYAQDDWHVNRWLTLNLGLRWDHFGQFSDAHGHRSNWQIDKNAFCIGAYACVEPYWPVFEPRIGFAVNAGHGWVVRGGFGMSYYPQDYAGGSVNLLNTPFMSINYTCYPAQTSGALACPAGIGKLSAGPPAVSLLTSDVNNPRASLGAHSDYYPPGYIEQYNLTFQKQVGANVFTVSYVGELGRHLSGGTPNANMPRPPGNAVQPTFLRVATLPNVTGISLYGVGGASEYNAAQFVFERRYAKGLTVNANYTFSRNLTNTTDGGMTAVMTVVDNRGYDWANADIGIKHRVSFRANYELPFGKTATGLKKQVIGGWQINTISSWQSGMPFTVTDGENLINLPNTTSDRPSLVPGQKLVVSNPTPYDWINYNAFIQQPIGTPGTEGKGMGFGPTLRSMDLSIFKDFPIRERYRLQFRAEAFNLSNTENFAQPGLSISKWAVPSGGGFPVATNAGSFGQITTSNVGANPRLIQFALKLSF